jgi:hypothetical protein
LVVGFSKILQSAHISKRASCATFGDTRAERGPHIARLLSIRKRFLGEFKRVQRTIAVNRIVSQLAVRASALGTRRTVRQHRHCLAGQLPGFVTLPQGPVRTREVHHRVPLTLFVALCLVGFQSLLRISDRLVDAT